MVQLSSAIFHIKIYLFICVFNFFHLILSIDKNKKYNNESTIGKRQP